jgi:glycosyl transferase family 21
MKAGGRLPLSYVVPLKAKDDEDWPGLASYLGRLGDHVAEVVLVDGSAEELFERHGRDAGGRWRHLRPDPAYDFAMGKVDGVTTGVLAAREELVVIADDDVRYGPAELRRVVELLRSAEVVRPQNYFDPLPWHAALDTGRTLLNRVWTGEEFSPGDFPGTLAIRRSAFEAIGGYDGDVIFENLELMRTVSAAGGRVVTPLDLYVRRLPPTTAHFRSQRIRQAYDDFAIPVRMALWLGVVPALGAAFAARRPAAIAAAGAAIAGIAEAGRRRAGGTRFFPASGSLLAPAWVLERGLSSWAALYRRATLGGIPYAGRVVPRAANSTALLRARVGGRIEARAARGLEADELVGPVAERVGAGPAAPADRDDPAA